MQNIMQSFTILNLFVTFFHDLILTHFNVFFDLQRLLNMSILRSYFSKQNDVIKG